MPRTFELLAAAGLLAMVAASVGAAEAPPVEAFSRLPLITDARLSPDGKQLAYLTNQGDASYLMTQTIGAGNTKPILRSDNEKVRARWFRWANNDLLLVAAAFSNSRRGLHLMETRLIGVEREGSEPRRYFEWLGATSHVSQFQDTLIGLLPDDPLHVLVALDSAKPGYPSVYELNVETGGLRRIHRYRFPIRGWMTDQQDRVRIGFGYENGFASAFARDLATGKWKKLWRYEPMKEPGPEVLGFGIAPNSLYVRAPHEGRSAIFTVDLSDPALPRTLLAHDVNYDIDGELIYSPLSRDVVGVYHSGADGARIYWNDAYQALQEMIDAELSDTINFLIDFSTDERRYIVFSSSDVNPGAFYYGNRDEGSLHRFASAYPELVDAPIAGKRPIGYTASDGVEIEGYLTPPWGEVAKPWPTIVLPHGGPHARDYATFDFMTEFLASRGYAVLQMNFRGSSGYGWDFASAAFEDTGGRMQDDVTDGAQWLVKRGIADPRRMCIMGSSYGGYAALWGTVKTPDLYRCAISLNGVSDWPMVLAESSYYVNRKLVRQRLGKRVDLKQVSPLRRAAEIQAPVLLVHGEEDRVVPVRHSRKMARALKRLKKPHRYVELEHGVHALTNQRNRTTFLREVEAFLAVHLAPEQVRFEKTAAQE